MFSSLALAALLSFSSAETVVRDFVAALARHDIAAVTGSAPISGSAIGTARELLQIRNAVTIDSYRVISVEPKGDASLVLVEMEGSATATGNGARVPLPRWWSLELKEGKLVSAETLERRLADQLALASPTELSAALHDHPELDESQFFTILANLATDAGGAGCPTLLWMLDETQTRGLGAAEGTAWEMVSYLATLSNNGPEAVLEAERSLELARASNDPHQLSDAWFSAGIGYWFANRLDEAVAALNRSFSYLGQVEDPRLPMRAAYMAGYLEMMRGNLREALVIADAHRAALERYPSPRGSLDNLFQLVTIHGSLGNLDIARRYNDDVRTVARQLDDRQSEAMATFNMAEIDYTRGAPTARALLEESYALSQGALEAGALTVVQRALASARLAEGDIAGAEELIASGESMAMASPDPNSTAVFLIARSALRLAQDRPEEALADARRAVSLVKLDKTNPFDPMAEALIAEGNAQRRLGRTDEAERAWRAAIEVKETQFAAQPAGETTFSTKLKGMLVPYRALLELLAEQGCAREGLAVAEQMRARLLRESLRRGRVDLSAGMTDEQRARELELEGALAEANRALLAASDPPPSTLRQQRDEARLALREFRSELFVKHPDVERRRRNPEDAPAEWQSHAAPGEVVVELAVTDHAVFAFVLHGDAIDVRRINVPRERLEKQVEELVTAIEQRDLAYRKSARALYDLLLAPAAKELASASRIRIVPDGVLWRVPFQALIDPAGRHLAESVAVAYSPSLALSRADAGGRTAPRTLLALADPAIGANTRAVTRSLFRDVSLGRLPDAAFEVKAIAPLYEGAMVRTGADAQEALFKSDAGAYRVLHLATHSIVDDGAPMFSSIVLAASKTNPLDDGLLEAREIADLDLRADLAVLSSCESARGALMPGEGVVGLSWAFLAAGVPTTVVSQWKVASASTADLMVRFHRNVHGGDAPADALRKAMIETRRDARWRHPFYWAPFVVIENSGSAGVK